VIGTPHNDRACLGPLTERIVELVAEDEPSIVAAAERFSHLDELAAWMRTLPQRDDEGLPCDGPKIDECRPPQRFRIDALDPNCVERAGKFIAVGEKIDPSRMYRLATTDTPGGLHTFPTVDGAPVVLDPKQSRNALRAGLFRECRNAAPVQLTPAQAVDWIADLASEPAARFKHGHERLHCGHRAMRHVLVLRPICIADIKHVAFVLALAEREARMYGPQGIAIVHSTAHAIDRLDRIAADRWMSAQSGPRNAGPFDFLTAGATLIPDLNVLGSLARVGGRIAGNVGLEALKLKLATMGITPPVLNSLEKELNQEGLSLGPLAKPSPMLGSLGAMTPEALAGRWLAGKL
jgi:hypothetical protein